MNLEREIEELRRDVKKLRRTRYLQLALIALLALPLWVRAASVESLSLFSNGEVASADAVNANFDLIADAVNDNDSRLTALSGAVTTLRSDFDNRPPRPQYVVVWHDGNAGIDGTDVCVAAGYRACTWEIRLDTNPIRLASCAEEWECPNDPGNATNCRLAVCTR